MVSLFQIFEALEQIVNILIESFRLFWLTQKALCLPDDELKYLHSQAVIAIYVNRGSEYKQVVRKAEGTR